MLRFAAWKAFHAQKRNILLRRLRAPSLRKAFYAWKRNVLLRGLQAPLLRKAFHAQKRNVWLHGAAGSVAPVSILRLFSQPGFRSAYVPQVFVKMRMGGASNRSLGNIVRKSREDLEALRRTGVGGVGALAWKNLGKLGQFWG